MPPAAAVKAVWQQWQSLLAGLPHKALGLAAWLLAMAVPLVVVVVRLEGDGLDVAVYLALTR